jgi:hypothetical protein
VKLSLVVVSAVALVVPAIAQRTPSVSTRDFPDSAVIDDSPGPGAFVTLGDVDGDGDLDLVLAKGRHVGSSSRLLINNGAGRFTATDIGVASDRSYGAAVADVDGDKDLDIVLSNELGLGRVFLNDGRAGFRHASDWGNASWPGRRALLADLNNDGRVDVAMAVRDPCGGTPSAICLNDGHGRFADCASLPFGPATVIVAADFDRDGHIDLAAPHRDRGQSFVAYNDGKGGFTRVVPFGPPNIGAGPAAAGDLNRDGWPDLVVGDDVMGIVIFFNNGRGALGPPRQVNLREVLAVNALAVADVNRDGSVDILAGYSSVAPARAPGSILYNDGTGQAYVHSRFGDGAGATYGLAVADLDSDGYPDITVARSAASSTVHMSRAGGSGTSITTSAEVVSPVQLFEAKPRDAASPIVGVWTGPIGPGDDIEVLIEKTEGTIAGRRMSHTAGIVSCVSSLALKENRSGAEYVFAETVEAGFCLGAVIRARQDTADELRLEVFFDPQPSPATKPNRTGLLKRKQ